MTGGPALTPPRWSRERRALAAASTANLVLPGEADCRDHLTRLGVDTAVRFSFETVRVQCALTYRAGAR